MDLPNELWLEVLAYVPHNDLHIIRVVSKRMYHLVSWTDYNSRRLLKISPLNVIEIKNYMQAGLNKDTDEQDANVLGSQMQFECVDISYMNYTPDWCFVLKHLGPYVKKLKLLRCELFQEIPELMPNVENLTIRGLSEMYPKKPLELSQFSKLKSIDLSSLELLPKTKNLLNSQLGDTQCTLALEHIAIDNCNDQNTLAVLSTLLKYRETLTSIAIHFMIQPYTQYDMWREVFNGLTKLRSIKITGCMPNEILEMAVDGIEATAPLKKVDLSGNYHTDNDVFKKIIEKWGHSLEELDLMFCANVSNEVILALKNASKTLRKLNVAYCRNISMNSLIESIASKENTVLRSLDLTDFPVHGPKELCQLMERLPNLESLNLHNCTHGVTDKVIETICQHQTNLKVLILDDCSKITDKAFIGFGDHPYPITRLQKLEKLSFRGCRKLTDLNLTHLQLPNLVSLNFGYCNRITSKGIKEMVKLCPSIQELVITSCMRIDDESCRYIVDGLKRLRLLRLNNCMTLSDGAMDYILQKHPTIKLTTMDGLQHNDIVGMSIINGHIY